MRYWIKISLPLSFALLLLTAPSASVGKIQKTLRKPAQQTRVAAKIQPIWIRVVYGEKISLFAVYKTPDGGRAELLGRAGAKSTVALSARNYEFLKNKLLHIPGTSNDKKFCQRNHISVFVNKRETVGCMGAANVTAREIQGTANLISLLF